MSRNYLDGNDNYNRNSLCKDIKDCDVVSKYLKFRYEWRIVWVEDTNMVR